MNKYSGVTRVLVTKNKYVFLSTLEMNLQFPFLDNMNLPYWSGQQNQPSCLQSNLSQCLRKNKEKQASSHSIPF